MLYVGVDLHKQSISVCVVQLADREREVLQRRRFRCDQVDQMAEYFAGLGQYQFGRRSNGQLRVVRPARRTNCRSGGVGSPGTSAGDRPKQTQDRQTRCANTGVVLGLGSDSRSLAANAPGTSASRFGPSPQLCGPADHFG